MNWLYFTVMGYIIASALRGYHKGFLRVLYSVLAIIATVIFVVAVAPAFRNVLLKSTTISQQIEKGSEKYVRKQIDKKLEDGAFSQSVKLPWVAVPKKLQKELDKAAGSAIPDILESYGIYKRMAKAAAEFCVSAIAFFLAFFIISIILYFVRRKVDWFSRKPGVHLVNMIFGFFAGIAKAFLVIWVVFILIQATEMLPISASLIEMIEENDVLRGLYEKNRLLELVKKF
ncbi:MAG: CvpA family protein [Eubacterium sp.]|nr:CvpA family protein [Eubacterium sp.]